MLYNRDEVDKKYQWRLSDIFATDEAWEECFFTTEERMPRLAEFADTLADESKLEQCLALRKSLSHDIIRMYLYAKMHLDEDAKNDKYQAMTNRVEMLFVRFETLASFIEPELSELSAERLEALAASEKFDGYDVYFKEILRSKNIILSKKEEKLLGEVGLFADTNHEVYNMFNNADVRFEPVVDDKGESIEMSHGMYGVLLQNPDENVRRQAFESMFGAFKANVNTLAMNYAGNVKKDWFFAKIRGFASALDYSMYRENVPSTCYKKLLEAVGDGTKLMHKYIALRKRALGLKNHNMYDLFLPLVPEQELSLSYEQAVDTVKDALKVMGEDYSKVLASAFESGWVDVYESKGKRSGAYSWGVYGVHPFVLLNYQPTVHDVFTIAHELGHSLHSYYSSQTQPEQKAEYEIFVAEIASTVNEVLLLKHLLKTATGEFRQFLLAYYLDMFRTTLFRQTMFSEFEVFAHTKVEKGEPLTAEDMCNYYYELNKKYYGRAIEHNELIRYEWARIPHFYTSYYVYKYATGITTAVTIANNILTKGSAYFEKYKKFLSAGGSLPPLDIIRLADVDLETDQPYKTAMAEFEATLNELEKRFEK